MRSTKPRAKLRTRRNRGSRESNPIARGLLGNRVCAWRPSRLSRPPFIALHARGTHAGRSRRPLAGQRPVVVVRLCSGEHWLFAGVGGTTRGRLEARASRGHCHDRRGKSGRGRPAGRSAARSPPIAAVTRSRSVGEKRTFRSRYSPIRAGRDDVVSRLQIDQRVALCGSTCILDQCRPCKMPRAPPSAKPGGSTRTIYQEQGRPRLP